MIAGTRVNRARKRQQALTRTQGPARGSSAACSHARSTSSRPSCKLREAQSADRRPTGDCSVSSFPLRPHPSHRSHGDSQGSFATIWAEEGIRGLYRGLGPTIFGYLPTWAIYFAVYDAAKPTFADMRSSESSSPFSRGRTGQADLSAGRHDGGDDVVAHIAAAVTAGATSTVATNPLWVIKTRFMVRLSLLASSRSHR